MKKEGLKTLRPAVVVADVDLRAAEAHQGLDAIQVASEFSMLKEKIMLLQKRILVDV
jgi:hypothetical protein